MNRKIYITVILCVIVFILVGIAFFVTRDTACNPYINIESERDVKACGCIDDPTEKAKCEANISGVSSYTEAAMNSDLSACEDIAIAEMKAACIKVVQGKIDFINKQ